jgi:hypothetical protein
LNNASKSGKGIPTFSVGNVWLINHYFAWICGIVQERGESLFGQMVLVLLPKQKHKKINGSCIAQNRS